MTTAEPEVQRVRHPLKLRTLIVRQVEAMTPNLVRITFQSPDLHDFVSASFDDHIKLLFPAEPGQAIATPVLGEKGLEFQQGQPRPNARDYTPRLFDTEKGLLVVDFILHGHGPATRWAAHAKVGWTLVAAGPRGSFVVPTQFDWHVLIGDDTAIPAIARRLEELPAQARAIVRVEVAGPEHELALSSKAEVDLQWLHRGAVPAYESSLLAAAANALSLPAGSGYVWVAAEASVAKAVRDSMVEQHGVHKSRIRAASYWRIGDSANHKNLDG